MSTLTLTIICIGFAVIGAVCAKIKHGGAILFAICIAYLVVLAII